MLEKEGFTVALDERALTPGKKFYYWEKRGVPLRLELGIREQTSNAVTIVKRHTLKRTEIPLHHLMRGLKQTLNEIDRDLLSRASASLNNHIAYMTSLDEIKKFQEQGKTILCISFCGNEECRHHIEDITNMEIIGYTLEKYGDDGNCIGCNQMAKNEVYLAKSH